VWLLFALLAWCEGEVILIEASVDEQFERPPHGPASPAVAL